VATYSGEGSLALSRAQNEHTLDRKLIIDSETNDCYGACCRLYFSAPVRGTELAAEQTEVKTLVESTRGHILERDPRCKMIMVDPGTAEPSGAVCETSVEPRRMAGVYGAVLVEATVRRGDAVELS
jgi:hypothetical protein